MTYGQFLAACRRLAGYDNKSEFARECLKLKRVNHYIGSENDKRKPGRQLLEAAARAAGIEFEDCIQLPVKEALSDELQNTLREFKKALADPAREAAAKLAVLQLLIVDKTKTQVGRGRKRKQ